MRRFFIVRTASLLMLASASSASAQDLVIVNGRLLDGAGVSVARGSIVIKGGRIASITEGTADVPGVPVLDAAGMTVLPGFIDGHRHVIAGNPEQWLQKQAADRLREFLEAGYTTLVSGGGPVPGIVQLKARIENGSLTGPRIITSGRADPDLFKSADEARAAVRKLAAAGIEIIKARLDPTPKPAQNAILAAVVDEGTKNGLDTMVHAVSVPSMLAALEAGAQKLVHTPHGSWLSEADAKKVADAGVEMLSTAGFGLPVFGVFSRDNVPTFRDGKPWPGGIIDGQGRGREAGEKTVNARTLWDAGVTYGFGTDTGYLPREGLKHELRALALMFSAQDIIKMMGPGTAAFMDTMSDRGRLEPGTLADIVLVNGDPLELIHDLLNVKVVIKGGAIVVDKR